MKLLLAIETSWNHAQVILGDGAGRRFGPHSNPAPTHTPAYTPTYTPGPPQDLSALISSALNALDADVRDIGGIAIDVGPGRLTSIRTGVAFANALAFSLKIPLYPFHYFEIMAKQVGKTTDLPVLSAVPAAGDLAYAGLLRGGGVEALRFGPLPAVAETLGAGLTEVAVAGGARLRLASLLHSATVTDTRAEAPEGGVLFEMGLAARGQATAGAATRMDRVAPMTEESEMFCSASRVHESS